MKIKEIKNYSSEFDQLANHPLQLWDWGEVRKKLKTKVFRFGVYKNKQLKKTFQLSVHQLPIFSWLIGYLPRSQILTNKELAFFYQWGKKQKIIFLKLEPYEKDNKQPYSFKQLVVSPHPLFPQWTQILDLQKTEEELLKKMHYKTRYNIRLAQRKGVKITEESNKKGFKIFLKLYFETCRRQKYFGHNQIYHQVVWKYFKNKVAHIFIAWYKNIPLAAYQIWFDNKNKTAFYVYGGSSTKYKNLMSTNLLMWHVVKWAKKQGAEKFDMWGSAPPNYTSKHPWAGFTRFKQGYGGQFVKMIGSYDLVINPFLYQIYNLFYRLRKIYLQILAYLNKKP